MRLWNVICIVYKWIFPCWSEKCHIFLAFLFLHGCYFFVFLMVLIFSKSNPWYLSFISFWQDWSHGIAKIKWYYLLTLLVRWLVLHVQPLVSAIFVYMHMHLCVYDYVAASHDVIIFFQVKILFSSPFTYQCEQNEVILYINTWEAYMQTWE